MSTVTKISEFLYRTESGVEFEFIANNGSNELEMSFGLDRYRLFEEPAGYEVEGWLRSFDSGLTDEEIADLATLTDSIFDN